MRLEDEKQFAEDSICRSDFSTSTGTLSLSWNRGHRSDDDDDDEHLYCNSEFDLEPGTEVSKLLRKGCINFFIILDRCENDTE